MINEERPTNERVIVMVEGAKAAADKSGAAPLEYALREVTRPSDEVFVLAVFNAKAEAETEASPLPSTGCCCMGEERLDQNSNTNTSDRDSCIWFLEEEINQRKETYQQIFRPYYDRCKGSGVKFRVKIAASFQPLALVAEEANNVDATWIVMDRCFVGEQSFQIYRASCSVALVSSDEVIVANRNSIVQELNPNPKSLENKYEARFPSLASTINGGGESSNTSNNPAELLPGKSSASDDDNIILTGFSKVNLAARMPLQLSWEVLEEVTGGFTRMTCMEENESCKLYCGYLSDHHSQFLVKILPGQLDYVVEAEKKAASAMYHRNILGLFGYHISEDATVLVYPFTRRWTLNKFLHCLKGKRLKLTFPEKLKVAIGIARGVRYMHEECPRGPIVHGDLRPCNIFLNSDLEPLARPLLLQRAYHELLDEDTEYVDMYGIYRVMSVAAQCLRAKPISRPFMTEVICLLKGETSCAVELSPSSEDSSSTDLVV
ncbi:uncharacterized protein LOC127791080 [Diospyros lotus]|uniref:uncharacterized protein LOC127791080 n=1 Tax=Diospyros lotus TaxID=55363 RepID=UPI0022557C06|nr:uncharacterized protein LOC127791080 [Diospyros lotus]